MFNRSIGILVHNELKFLRISGTLSLEATNTPGTAKVLGSNLTRTFFSNRIIFLAKIYVCLC